MILTRQVMGEALDAWYDHVVGKPPTAPERRPDEKVAFLVEYLAKKAVVEDRRTTARVVIAPPQGTDSVEEAIAEEICSMAHHHRDTSYAGGFCAKCMAIAEFAVTTTLRGVYLGFAGDYAEAIDLARRMVVVTKQDWRNEDPRTLAYALVAVDETMREKITHDR